MDGETRWFAAGVVTFVIAGFLLVSMGGAIIAAPVIVPLMFIAASRHPTRGFRVVAGVLSAFTVAEVAWLATYLVAEEEEPWIWLVPCLSALAVLAFWRRLSRPALPRHL